MVAPHLLRFDKSIVPELIWMLGLMSLKWNRNITNIEWIFSIWVNMLKGFSCRKFGTSDFWHSNFGQMAMFCRMKFSGMAIFFDTRANTPKDSTLHDFQLFDHLRWFTWTLSRIFHNHVPCGIACVLCATSTEGDNTNSTFCCHYESYHWDNSQFEWGNVKVKESWISFDWTKSAF